MAIKLSTQEYSFAPKSRDLVSEATALVLARDAIFRDCEHIKEVDTVVDNLCIVTKAIRVSQNAKNTMKYLGVLDQCCTLLDVSEEKLGAKIALEGLGQKIIDGIRSFFKMIANLIRRILDGIRRMFMSKDEKARDDAARVEKATSEALKKMSEKERLKLIKAEWFKQVRGALAANTGLPHEIGIYADKVIEAKDDASVGKVFDELESRMKGKKEFFKTLYESEPNFIEGESFARGSSDVSLQLQKYKSEKPISCTDAGYTDIKDWYQTCKVISVSANAIATGIDKELGDALKILEQKCGVKDSHGTTLANIKLDMNYATSTMNGDKTAADLVRRKGKVVLTVVATLRDILFSMHQLVRATDIWNELNKEIDSVAADAAKTV